MIKNISVEGFRNINIDNLDLGRVNLLVGEAQSGKSNFLNSIAHVGRVIRNNMPMVFGSGPKAFEQTIFKKRSPDDGIGIKITFVPNQRYNYDNEEFNCDEVIYGITVRKTSQEAPTEIIEEFFHIVKDGEIVQTLFETDERKKVSFDDNRYNSNRDSILYIHRNKYHSYPLLDVSAKTLSRQITYRFNPYCIGYPVSDEEDINLRFDGGRLPAVLHTIRSNDRESFEFIEDSFKDIFPDVEKITLPLIGNAQSNRALGVIERDFDTPFTAREMGDSALVMLAIITVASLPEPPAIVCIDDLDRYLSKDMIDVAVKILAESEQLKDSQLIFSIKEDEDSIDYKFDKIYNMEEVSSYEEELAEV